MKKAPASAAVRRILQELREIQQEEAEYQKQQKEGASSKAAGNELMFKAAPLENDLFEWHFTARGTPGTCFQGGVYHGRIILPPEYPMKAPEIILLTPNGRFEVGTRICLSITSYHQETWQPSWGIRTIITALISFFPSKAEGIGALNYSEEDRKKLSLKSWDYHCELCGVHAKDELHRLSQENTETIEIKLDVSEKSKVADLVLNPSSNVAASSSGVSAVAPATSIMSQASSSAKSPKTLKVNFPSSSAEGEPSYNVTSEYHNQNIVESVESSTPVITSNLPQQQISNRRETSAQPLFNEQQQQPQSSEKELLYLAYAIFVAICAIVLRRLFQVMDFSTGLSNS